MTSGYRVAAVRTILTISVLINVCLTGSDLGHHDDQRCNVCLGGWTPDTGQVDKCGSVQANRWLCKPLPSELAEGSPLS